MLSKIAKINILYLKIMKLGSHVFAFAGQYEILFTFRIVPELKKKPFIENPLGKDSLFLRFSQFVLDMRNVESNLASCVCVGSC
jgi:hypothetical protein